MDIPSRAHHRHPAGGPRLSALRPLRRVGVVGLGRMGLPIARHLVRAGFAVCGFDLDPERRVALLEARGSAATALPELARTSEVVLVVVADDAQVMEAVLGRGGLLDSVMAGTTVIISSTVKPSTVRKVAAACSGRGVGVLDAPLARGQRGAEAGTLAVFAAGEATLFERCRPILEAFSAEVVHIGEEVGVGQVAKLANNLMLWAGVVAAHEALRFGEEAGVSPHRLRAALRRGSADSYALRELDLMTLAWPDKDLQQALEFAEEIGGVLPLAERVRELMQVVTREELRRLCDEGAGRPGG